MAADEISGVDFRHELDRVLRSTTFANAAKQRDLLRWLVDQVLTREAPAVSQYEIATCALDYGTDYDSSSDSRVRTSIGRLRERLGKYYSQEGRLNRFRIVLDEGRYAPRLIAADPILSLPRRQMPQSPSDKLSVLVLPCVPVGFVDSDLDCDGLTLDLMRAMAASGQARIVPWTTAHWLAGRTGDKREHYLKTGADVILEPLLQRTSANRWRVSVQWVDGPTGLLDSFCEVQGGAGDTLAVTQDLAGQITGRLHITYDERSWSQVMLRHSADPAASIFYVKARRDALTFTPSAIRRAFELLAHAMGRDPHFAAAYALQAELHLAVSDAGAAPASEHAPLAREAAERSLQLAPELGDSLAARGAVELTYDWDFFAASQTLKAACADPLADAAPHWPPMLALARGKNEEAAMQFEAWAKLDPGSAAKAGVASEFWYYAGQFDLAIRWGLNAIELDSQNLRAGLMVAGSYMQLGRADESLRIAREMHRSAPQLCETNFILAALLACAGHTSEARQVISNWDRIKAESYEPPIMLAIAYGWLGETSKALEAMHRVVQDRQTVCLFARSAPYLSPLHGHAGFERMLADAGLPAIGEEAAS